MGSLSQAIKNQISILDICEEFSIKLENVNNGSFTHRCRCPFHKDGNERTPSLYIDSTNNTFFCYGCGAGNTVINFYNLFFPDYEELDCVNDLRSRIDSTKKYPKKIVQNNFQLQIEMSGLLRYYNQKFPDRFEEIKDIQKELDLKMEKIGYNDIVSATKVLSSLRKALKRRFT